MLNKLKKMHEEEIQLEKAKEALTIELLQKILQNSKNDSTITILDIKIEFATKKGDNYASNMFRIFIQFRKREKEEIEVEQFIAKFVPILEGQFKEYVRDFFDHFCVCSFFKKTFIIIFLDLRLKDKVI